MVVFCELLIERLQIPMVEALALQYRVHKAELLFLARRQLDKLGLKCGYLPKAMPFVMSGPLSSDNALSEATQPGDITNSDLFQALADPAIFRQVYELISTRTMEAMVVSNRKQTTAKILDDLTSLQMYPLTFYLTSFTTLMIELFHFGLLFSSYQVTKGGMRTQSHCWPQFASSFLLGGGP